MLLMVEKEIIRGKHHAIHKNAKANNKYMKIYYRNKEPQYAICLDVNNPDGWKIPRKLPANGFKQKRIYQNLIQSL